MWKLLKYMKAYKKEAVCAPLFKLLEALFELFVPLVMAKIIDIGIAQGDRPYIFQQKQRSDLRRGCAMGCLHIFRACRSLKWMCMARQR